MSTISFKQLMDEARQTSRETFAKEYPHPFLVAEQPGGGRGSNGRRGAPNFETMAGLPDVRTVIAAAEARRIYPVAKSGRNHFGDMITLGRADNNDIIIIEPSVSKFHAYFNTDLEGDYVLCDADSSFGTELANRGIGPDQPQPVTSGDRITLGRRTVLTFYLPDELYDLLLNW